MQPMNIRNFPNSAFELRSQLQTALWSVELLELRLHRDSQSGYDCGDLKRQIQQVRQEIEQTCQVCTLLHPSSGGLSDPANAIADR